MAKINRVIISVSDKEGVADFAKSLDEMGVEILSTGGTAKRIRESGAKVTDISEYTGSGEILSGRVKTLHPMIHGGILAVRSSEGHQKEMKDNNIKQIDMVVVNLYPFEDVIKKEDVTLEEAIENIDIGGPTMLRAAAKNYNDVSIVTDPKDYKDVIKEIRKNNGSVTDKTNVRLAIKAFSYVARYDAAISNYLSALNDDGTRSKLPRSYTLHLEKKMDLRYGENPHQEGAFYVRPHLPYTCISNAEQLWGKELSLNNIYDANSALELVKEFSETACVVVKHNNPCGVATDGALLQAFLKARECDPVSAFGGIVAFNREVDEPTAQEINGMFVEVVIAPGYDEKALEVFKSKKNIRILQVPGSNISSFSEFDFKKVVGGMLIQDGDSRSDQDFEGLKVASSRQPTEQEVADMKFAWKVCKHVKSNAIIFAKDGRTVGIGAGQMNRVDSVKIAAMKAQVDVRGSVLASDAFFPFRDGIDEAAEAGITAIVQPGGSIKDEETIAAADEHGMSMVFTAIRHFKH